MLQLGGRKWTHGPQTVTAERPVVGDEPGAGCARLDHG